MDSDKWQKETARLDEMQRRIQKRLDEQHAHIARHLDRRQAHIDKKYGKAQMNADMQARIIRAGLELLKEDGLDNLSLRKLARRVNMQAPALYWYFKDKAILVDYLAEGILQSEFGKDFGPRATGESWEEWLRTTMIRLRSAMLAYPDGGRVVAGARLYPAETLAQLIEYTLQSLITSGVSIEQARTIHMTAINYTFGFVIEEQAAPNQEEVKDFDISTLFNNYPYLHSMIGSVDFSEEASGRSYEAGLDAIIRGSSMRP